jgi:SAM-dependent methyltransferase
MKWLVDLKLNYPPLFNKSNILEIGAEGTWPEVRELFPSGEYTGVDRIAGPNVDIVGDAATIEFTRSFDVILCLSMFEHDPQWKDSLTHILQYLKPGGYVIGCHGAEGNLHHGPAPWEPVPSQEFLDFCETLPVIVMDSFFEEERYGPDCAGAFDWLLKKHG